jgi:hypothetical protein
MINDKSPSHSLTRILANKRRKLVLTPGFVNYPGLVSEMGSGCGLLPNCPLLGNFPEKCRRDAGAN